MIRDIPANTNPGQNLERLDSKQVTIQDTTELLKKRIKMGMYILLESRRVVFIEYFNYIITAKTNILMEYLVHLFLINTLFRQNKFCSVRPSVNLNSMTSSHQVSLKTFFYLKDSQQECIPVGYVPPAH